jgi:hypothetical protein
MGALAELILRIDELSSSEEAALIKYLAERKGLSFPSGVQALPVPTSTLTDRQPQFKTETAVAAPGDSPEARLHSSIHQSDEWHKFMSAVAAATEPIPSGPGRKSIIFTRINELINAWNNVPASIKSLVE